MTSNEVYDATAGADFDLSLLPVPIREGYTFVGWQSGEKLYAPDAVIRPVADMTLLALWKKDASVFLLTFDPKNGGEPEVLSVRDGEVFDLATPTIPLKEGFEFLGWKNEDTVYLEGETNALVPLDDMTFTAEWRALKYKITFKNGEVTLSETEYLYGETPKAPAFGDPLPEKKFLSETEIAVFRGWDKTIAAVKEEAVYNAVYETQTRLYTLTLNSAGVRFEDASGAPIDANYGAYNSIFRFKIGLKKGSRDDGMIVKLNGEVLVADANGMFTVTLDRDGLEITVENVRFMKFDTVLKVFNASYRLENDANYGVAYGDSFEFYAWGGAGFNENAPNVKYDGEAALPIGQDADGKYRYRIDNVTKNAEIEISGVYNVYDVTYIDWSGNRIELKWTADMNTLGYQDPFGDAYYPNHMLYPEKFVPGGETAYFPAGFTHGSGISFKLTKSAEQSDRLISLAEYNKWNNKDTVFVPTLPSYGDDLVYYLVYYEDTIYYDTYLNVPDGFEPAYYDYNSDTAAMEYSMMSKNYDGFEGKLARFYVGWSLGTMPVKLFGGNGGAYPMFRDADGRTVSADTEGIYYFTIDRASEWSAVDVITHTVTIQDNQDTDFYALENRGHLRFPSAIFEIPDGSDFIFYFKFKTSKTNVERDPLTYRDSVLVNGAPCETFNDPDFYKPMIDGYDLWSGPEPRFHYIVRNVKEDISITWSVPEDKPYTIRFPVSGDYSYQLNGETLDQSNPLTDASGKKYIDIAINLSNDDFRVIPKPGYVFDASVQLKFYYAKCAILKDSAGNSVGIGVTGFSTTTKYGYASSGYKVLLNFYGSNSLPVETDSTFEGITDAKKLVTVTMKLVPDNVAVTQWTNRSNPTEQGAVFAKQPATKANKIGTYSVSISVPDGKFPVFYIEWSDAVSESFRTLPAATVSGNTYTFEVVDPKCDFRWYILLKTGSYEVTFDWGADRLTLTLPHGTLLKDVALPETFIGEQNGVRGVFKVLRWNHADGTRFLLTDRSETVTPVTEFTAAAATMNGELFYSVADALKSLTAESTGTLDVLTSATGEHAETLKAGTAEVPEVYTIPAGVTLRLPFREGGYGYCLAQTADSPSLLYAPLSLGVLGLTVPENAVIELYGAIVVGGIIGYPQSARPYQGHISGAHAVLKLNGKINVQAGGVFECYGYTEGAGSIEAFSGGTVKSSFVVRDYRGGTSSLGVYSENIAPFNVYEAPNLLVPATIDYGAKEVVKAVLYASNNYNETEMDVLGGAGVIQLNEGGKIVRSTRRVVNDRYTEATKSYEPAYEFRTQIDVYGGGRDDVMSLAGIASTKDCQLGINFAYDIRLHAGKYALYNMYKIMPGGKLTVGADATLTIANENNLAGLVTAYAGTFREVQTYAHKQLYYPPITEAGKFTVNGKLIVYGKLGAEVRTEAAGASIEVYCVSTYLTVAQREGTAFSFNFSLTYSATVNASVNGTTPIAEGDYYVSAAAASGGGFVWKKD